MRSWKEPCRTKIKPPIECEWDPTQICSKPKKSPGSCWIEAVIKLSYCRRLSGLNKVQVTLHSPSSNLDDHTVFRYCFRYLFSARKHFLAEVSQHEPLAVKTR